jgi:type I restriction enzyme R subunit
MDTSLIKKVAKDLLDRLKSEKLKIDNWRAKQATRDAVRTEILNFLYDERTGLPTIWYSDDEVNQKANRSTFVFIAYLMSLAPCPTHNLA